MTVSNFIPRSSWKEIKAKVRRTKAFNTKYNERQAIRNTVNYFKTLYPENGKDIFALPISTMQWSSLVLKHKNHKIGLIDVEQANALTFLFSRDCFMERPIYPYVEFMIRAAEVLYDGGQAEHALMITNRCLERLTEYSRHHNDTPKLKRPQGMPYDFTEFLFNHSILTFVTGHEIGHLLQLQEDTPIQLLEWVETLYDEYEFEDAKHMDGPKFHKFIKPEIIQKFNDEGLHNGDITQGIKLKDNWFEYKKSQINEVHSDLFGIIAVTQLAIREKISPEILFKSIFKILELSEMLMVLKRTISRLPNGQRRTYLLQEHSNLVVRHHLSLKIIEAFHNGNLTVDKSINEYWSQLDQAILVQFLNLASEGILEAHSLSSTHMIRGGVCMGLGNTIAPCPEPKQIHDKWGMLAGDAFFWHQYQSYPHSMYRIEDHHDWQPRDNLNPLLCAFGGAMRDISNVLSLHSNNVGFSRVRPVDRDAEEKFIELLRSPRIHVAQRQLNFSDIENIDKILQTVL